MKKPNKPKFPKSPKSKNKDVLKRHLERVSAMRLEYDKKIKDWEKAEKETNDLKVKIQKARSI